MTLKIPPVRLAILGAVSTGLDFDFLHKLERKVRTRTAESGVGRVHTVENVVVLRTGRTGHRRVAVTAGSITQTRTRYCRGDRVKRPARCAGSGSLRTARWKRLSPSVLAANVHGGAGSVGNRHTGLSASRLKLNLH